MGNWHSVTCGELLDFGNGKSSPVRNDEGRYLVYGSNGVIGRSDVANAKAPFIVIGRVGSYCGSVYFSDCDAWVTDNAICATAKMSFDAEFLYYLLRHLELDRWRGGSGQPLLNQATLRSVPVLTTLDPGEQRAIAGVLGALDDKIESNRRLVDLLRQNAKAVAEDACSNAEKRRLGDIAVFQRGFGYKSSGFAESGKPMISMGCSERRGWLRRDKVRTYGDAVKEKYLVRAEQLLVVNVDLTWKLDVLGWPLLVPPDLDGAIISNDIFGVLFAEGDEWLSWVVWAELQTWSARSVIEGGAKGTTVASVGIDTLGQVEIRIPDRDVGASVAEAMSAFIRRAWTAEQESVQLTALRDALLPALLSGRLRVRDAEKVVEGAV